MGNLIWFSDRNICHTELSALSVEKSLKVEDPDGIFLIEKANGCRIPIKKTDEVCTLIKLRILRDKKLAYFWNMRNLGTKYGWTRGEWMVNL